MEINEAYAVFYEVIELYRDEILTRRIFQIRRKERFGFDEEKKDPARGELSRFYRHCEERNAVE